MSRSNGGDPLDRFLARMPKAELHLHLEGTLRPATLLELAKRRRVDLPADSEAGVRRWFRFSSFEEFVHIYLTCSRCLRHPEDFQLVARQHLEEMARQSVLYCEAHLTVGTHAANGVNLGELADALAETLSDGRRRLGVDLRLVPDIVRNVPERADLTLEWALGGCGRGVVALGLSGFETLSCEPFREHFAAAAGAGLGRVAHAGEHGGPDSIRSAIAVCGAQRIGHGIAAAAEPALCEQLRRDGVPLEICPSSNLALGRAPRLEQHPFEELRQAGVAVTVNSDDPPFFDTTLTDEYRRLRRAFGYSAETLAELSLAAVRHAFLEPSQKRQLEAEFYRRLAAAGAAELGYEVAPSGDRGRSAAPAEPT